MLSMLFYYIQVLHSGFISVLALGIPRKKLDETFFLTKNNCLGGRDEMQYSKNSLNSDFG